MKASLIARLHSSPPRHPGQGRSREIGDTPGEPARAALLPKRVIRENTRIQHEAMRLAVTADQCVR
jgi:hypothetical protein